MTSDWKLYLSRPFDLFSASVWNEWYASTHAQDVLGVRFTEGLFIEYPHGVTRQYRRPADLERMMDAIATTVRDETRTTEILEQALRLNAEANIRLADAAPIELEEAVNFLIRLAHHAGVFPLFAADHLATSHNRRLREMCDELRSISLYPRVLEELVIPAADRRLQDLGSAPTDRTVCTYRELISRNVAPIPNRQRERYAGHYFVLSIEKDTETVSYSDTTLALVDELEGSMGESSDQVIGTSAYKGYARGTVRLVLHNDLRSIQFSEGDILIAHSTNPVLAPIMRKAAAIVTDEGGLTCHAAILSRELQTPCVVGTKRATRVFKDGDTVEVDADTGLVRRIEKAG